MRYSWIASAFCCLLVAAASPAQQGALITIRLIDITNGKPASQRGIWIERINPDTHMPIVEDGMPLKGMTDIDGKVTFFSARLYPNLSANQSGDGGMTEAVPRKRLSKFLDVEITYAGGGIQCSTGLFSLDEIFTSGVVGDNRCNKKFDPTKFKSTPGEVIIFVGKYHWWEAGQW
jgi:hypothetical protein